MVEAMSADARREIVLAAVRGVRELGVPLRVLAPIIAHVDTTRCPDCARTFATHDDWVSEAHGEGERDDLCWGHGANCELDYEGVL